MLNIWKWGKRQGSKPVVSTTELELSIADKLQRRYLRIFVSHRYKEDGYLHQLLTSGLENFEIDDLSLIEALRLKGARGGPVEEIRIKREIAARIYASDIVIAPSTKAALKPRKIRTEDGVVEVETDWISWEIQVAAICFNIPVLFIDQKLGVQRRNQLYNKLRSEGAKVAACVGTRDEVLKAIDRLFDKSVLDYRNHKSEIQELHEMRVPAEFPRVLEKHPYRTIERGGIAAE